MIILLIIIICVANFHLFCYKKSDLRFVTSGTGCWPQPEIEEWGSFMLGKFEQLKWCSRGGGNVSSSQLPSRSRCLRAAAGWAATPASGDGFSTRFGFRSQLPTRMPVEWVAFPGSLDMISLPIVWITSKSVMVCCQFDRPSTISVRPPRLELSP